MLLASWAFYQLSAPYSLTLASLVSSTIIVFIFYDVLIHSTNLSKGMLIWISVPSIMFIIGATVFLPNLIKPRTLSFVQIPQFPFDDAPNPDGVIETLWIRLGVENVSKDTLDSIQVKWMSINKAGEDGTNGLNRLLKTEYGESSISLNPGDIAHYVFASYMIGDDDTRYIQTVIPGMRIQEGRWPDRELPAMYTIGLQATGENTPAIEEFYTLTMTMRGFSFEIAGDSRGYNLIQPFPLEEQILLCELYGGEWHTSNDEGPIFLRGDQAYLKNHFIEGNVYSFMPIIYNGSANVSLERGVELYIEFPPRVEVREKRLWSIVEKSESTTFYTRIPAEIHPGSSMGVNEDFSIVFPEPGRYPVKYYIQGRTVKGEALKKIIRNFDFVLD